MTTVHQIYSTLNTEYEYANDSTIIDYLPYTTFDTIVTNRLFTPDNGVGISEDLQIRVSKDIKFFVGSNDGSSNDKYSLKISDFDDTALIDSMRTNLNLQANLLSMNSLKINNNAGTIKVSTDKVLQIHSANRIEMIGKTEFSNEVRIDQNLYLGKSIVFYNGESSTDNVRIALQYNTSKDTIDIVKQSGSGGDVRKKLMARLGQGNLLGSTDSSLQDVPYYLSPSVSSSTFTTSATVFDAANIWKQLNSTLYYGVDTNERIGIGISNLTTEKLKVAGETKINDILITTQNIISGVKTLFSSNITTNVIVNTGDATINGKTTVNNIDVTSINFKNNGIVNNFNGNLTTLSNDLAPWLQNNQNSIQLSGFNNDLNFISKLQEVVIDTKWRLKEDGEELRIEKYNTSSSLWEEKFKFS
jgi:hypothetical protein